jgi:hypothetical protein
MKNKKNEIESTTLIVLLQPPIFLLELVLGKKGLLRSFLGLCNLGTEGLFYISMSGLLQALVYLADRKLGL